MIGHLKCQYEKGTGLGKFRDVILMLTEVKSQSTNFSLGFKPTRKDIKAMIAQRKDKQRAKAVWQTSEAPLKIPHLSITFPTPYYIYQPQALE